MKKTVDCDEFTKMYLDYVSVSDICTHFHIGERRYREIKDELRLPQRKTRYHLRKRRCDAKMEWFEINHWNPDDDELFTKMWLDGIKIKTMCTRFRVCSQTLRNVRKRLGLAPRKVKNNIDIEELKSLIEAGLTPIEIGKHLGVSYTTLYSIARRNRIKLGEPVEPIDVGRLIELNKQGLTDTEISKIFGCSASSASMWRCRLGLTSVKSKRFNMRLHHREIVADDHQPDVKSDESLYCDTQFLESYFGKKIGS